LRPFAYAASDSHTQDNALKLRPFLVVIAFVLPRGAFGQEGQPLSVYNDPVEALIRIDGSIRALAGWPRIFCAYDPADFPGAVAAGYDLAFAGHLHGGQCLLANRDSSNTRPFGSTAGTVCDLLRIRRGCS